MYTGDIELFRDEILDYGRCLPDAGVPTDVLVVEGAPHGCESLAPTSELAGTLFADARAWLARIGSGAGRVEPASMTT